MLTKIITTFKAAKMIGRFLNRNPGKRNGTERINGHNNGHHPDEIRMTCITQGC